LNNFGLNGFKWGIGAVNPDGTDSGLEWDADNPDPDDAGWEDYVLNLRCFRNRD